jgi:uncharacterized protein YihD (DUF1040 family)
MRDPNRIRNILDKLQEIWERYPDLRFGQLIMNLFKDYELFYMEDEELMQEIEDLIKLDKEDKQ